MCNMLYVNSFSFVNTAHWADLHTGKCNLNIQSIYILFVYLMGNKIIQIKIFNLQQK